MPEKNPLFAGDSNRDKSAASSQEVGFRREQESSETMAGNEFVPQAPGSAEDADVSQNNESVPTASPSIKKPSDVLNNAAGPASEETYRAELDEFVQALNGVAPADAADVNERALGMGDAKRE